MGHDPPPKNHHTTTRKTIHDRDTNIGGKTLLTASSTALNWERGISVFPGGNKRETVTRFFLAEMREFKPMHWTSSSTSAVSVDFHLTDRAWSARSTRPASR